MDPLGVIFSRVDVNRHTIESQALRKASLAVIATKGDMAEATWWVLGTNARGLLNAFATAPAHRGATSNLEIEINPGRNRGCAGYLLYLAGLVQQGGLATPDARDACAKFIGADHQERARRLLRPHP